MNELNELPVSGNVNTTIGVYTRKDNPSVFAPVAHELPAGSHIAVHGAVVGDAIEGNAHWYRVGENTFIWAGACTRLEPYPAFPQSGKTSWMAVVFQVR